MKNNKGLGRFETIIVILLLLVIFAFLAKVVLNSVSGKNFTTMRNDAVNFGKAVSANAYFYQNSEKVTLAEAVAEESLSKIKNPVGEGYCDETESKVVIHDGKYLVTLRCGDYLIDNESIPTMDKAPIYEVGKWSEEKIDGADKVTLYNCEKDGKEVYPEYYDALYFIYKVNYDFSVGYMNVDDINQVCKVLKKDVYREKKK